ncbi:MAG: membrane protein insertase YidC [Rhizomicrobium sp.]
MRRASASRCPTTIRYGSSRAARCCRPGHPVTLSWDNGHGLVFTRRIEVDDQFMFTVTDGVQNRSAAVATLYPYALVARDGVPPGQKYWVLHEGFVAWADSLKDASYDDFKDDGTPAKTFSATGGWAGITDKYWMAAVIPPQHENYDGSFRAETFGATKALLCELSARGAQRRGGRRGERDASPVRRRQGGRHAAPL